MAKRLLSTQRIVNLAADPATGTAGEIYYNTVSNSFKYYDGSAWSVLSTGVPVGGTGGQILAKIDATNYNTHWIDNIANYTSQVKHNVKAAAAINKGQAVYVSSADGSNIIVSKASNSSEVTSSKTMGLLEQDLSTNATGFVVTEGLVSGLNTSGANAGDPVWLGTDGNLLYGVNNKPAAPAHMVFIGIVTRVQQNNGQIFVKVQNGFELQELHNVSISNPTTGQTLKYNSATGLWENGSIDGAVFEVFYQADSPSSPQLGDIWVESDVDVPEYDNISIDVLVPNQSGNSGKYLTTNGTSVSWSTVNSLPSQSGNSGKYLTTDGTTASWATLDLSLYAPLSSPALTGVPTAPTATAATNTTQIATTAFVRTEISNLIDSAPGALDTLNELAAAINDDANFATTITTALSGKEPTIASGTTSQYWRGDKSWQTLDKSAVGLSNVENTALSTWTGSSNITTLGTISSGTWQGSSISSTYIDSAIARLSSPTFTGTANAERLSVDSTVFIDTITTTVSSINATEIDSFAQSSFSSCEYLIQIKQGSKVTILKALMTSADLDIVQYGIVESGGTIPYTITTDSFIPGGGGGSLTNKLLITITDANSTSATVKVVRTSVV